MTEYFNVLIMIILGAAVFAALLGSVGIALWITEIVLRWPKK